MAKINQKPLKPADEAFCRFYAGDSSVFNNATMAYAFAFNKEIPEKDGTEEKALERKKILAICATQASMLLRNPNIQRRCQEVLSALCNDHFVDREMTYTIAQRKDLGSKMRAVSEYNKLKKRVSEKVEHTGEIKMTWEE